MVSQWYHCVSPLMPRREMRSCSAPQSQAWGHKLLWIHLYIPVAATRNEAYPARMPELPITRSAAANCIKDVEQHCSSSPEPRAHSRQNSHADLPDELGLLGSQRALPQVRAARSKSARPLQLDEHLVVVANTAHSLDHDSKRHAAAYDSALIALANSFHGGIPLLFRSLRSLRHDARRARRLATKSQATGCARARVPPCRRPCPWHLSFHGETGAQEQAVGDVESPSPA